MGQISIFNVQNQGIIHTPAVVVHGQSTYSKDGILTVSHQKNAYPPLHFEVNHGFFKAVIRLEDGANDLVFTHSSGTVGGGFPSYNRNPTFNPGAINFTINYQPLRNNLPVHLCLLVAKDSPALFDSTSLKKSFEGNGIDVALKKLRVGGRLMQAFTNEQMLRAGFGNRTFNFYEEVSNETEYYQEAQNPRSRQNIKIHVLKSDKTLRELRDPNLAQQNSKGTNTGGLFGIAKDALDKYGGPFRTNEQVQAAVMFLDTHWDNKLQLILTHAALGGNIGNLKLAIFGSHGLYSWPTYLEQVASSFQDTNRSSITEVANDSNQCSSYWECLNITLGAFMHEIGHLLGCPHQTSGVMLRDYITLNRSFVSRETYCVRTNSNGLNPVLPKDECTWHRLDLLRFLYHPSFRLPEDSRDPSFGFQNNNGGGASVLPIGNGQAVIKSSSGIYAIEVYNREIADSFFEYLPTSLSGRGVQYQITVGENDFRNIMPKDKKNSKDFRINILTVGGSTNCDNFVEKIRLNNTNVIELDGSEINRSGKVSGLKSNSHGNYSENGRQLILFDPKTITNIRVYYGAAIDGLRFDYIKYKGGKPANGPPPIPARNYSLTGAFKKMFIGGGEGANQQQPVRPVPSNEPPPYQTISAPEKKSVLFGKQTNNYADFQIRENESLRSFNLRTGAWIDGVQIVTSSGRASAFYGNSTGGGPQVLEAPNDNDFEIVGVYGSVSRWVDSIGIIYARK